MKKDKTIINHWRFEDGKTSSNPGNTVPLDPPPQGWYCWVYPSDDLEFETWMKKFCPTAECIHRFNSGDPMYTVYIKEPDEAMFFSLKWF